MIAIGDGGFYLETGPFITHVSTRIPRLLEEIERLYDGYPIANHCAFADFHVTLACERRWYRPKVQFYFDGRRPYEPLPLHHATPMFEWCLNWCIATHANQYLMIHAAAVEKGGRAAILPGQPGSGKSTLTAALVNRGWRLLSDEFTLIAPDEGHVCGLARPISLKNQSIELLRDFAPESIISDVVHDTLKGRVALMRAPLDSIHRVNVPARPGWIIFPQYRAAARPNLTAKSEAETLMALVDNAFNYNVHGPRGFRVLADCVEECGRYQLTYSALDDAVEIFDRL